MATLPALPKQTTTTVSNTLDLSKFLTSNKIDTITKGSVILLKNDILIIDIDQQSYTLDNDLVISNNSKLYLKSGRLDVNKQIINIGQIVTDNTSSLYIGNSNENLTNYGTIYINGILSIFNSTDILFGINNAYIEYSNINIIQNNNNYIVSLDNMNKFDVFNNMNPIIYRCGFLYISNTAKLIISIVNGIGIYNSLLCMFIIEKNTSIDITNNFKAVIPFVKIDINNRINYSIPNNTLANDIVSRVVQEAGILNSKGGVMIMSIDSEYNFKKIDYWNFPEIGISNKKMNLENNIITNVNTSIKNLKQVSPIYIYLASGIFILIIILYFSYKMFRSCSNNNDDD